jgi:hypothetical protein
MMEKRLFTHQIAPAVFIFGAFHEKVGILWLLKGPDKMRMNQR